MSDLSLMSILRDTAAGMQRAYADLRSGTCDLRSCMEMIFHGVDSYSEHMRGIKEAAPTEEVIDYIDLSIMPYMRRNPGNVSAPTGIDLSIMPCMCISPGNVHAQTDFIFLSCRAEVYRRLFQESLLLRVDVPQQLKDDLRTFVFVPPLFRWNKASWEKRAGAERRLQEQRDTLSAAFFRLVYVTYESYVRDLLNRRDLLRPGSAGAATFIWGWEVLDHLRVTTQRGAELAGLRSAGPNSVSHVEQRERPIGD